MARRDGRSAKHEFSGMFFSAPVSNLRLDQIGARRRRCTRIRLNPAHSCLIALGKMQDKAFTSQAGMYAPISTRFNSGMFNRGFALIFTYLPPAFDRPRLVCVHSGGYPSENGFGRFMWRSWRLTRLRRYSIIITNL